MILAHTPDFPDLADFGRDPWWLMLAKAIGVFAFLVVTVLAAILVERKAMARMQRRLGPNRVGWHGLLQSLADGVKLALKEGMTPFGVDKPLYLLAPIIAVVPAFLAFAVIPMGPSVSVFGHHTPLQLTDLPVAVLYVLAVTSIGVYGIVLAGWSSGSTYPLLGGLRSTAQVISYEIAMGLSFAAVFLLSATMSTSGIVAGQHGRWYVLVLLPSFVIYAISMVGETNRAPFDLPEAEGELVGGFHTEYSSMKFAMFFLAEYVNMATVSALASTMFFGGWRAPFWIDHIWAGANHGWWPMLWWFLKVWFFLSCFIWLRAALPRMRYDQFMAFGWKFMIPTALVWTLFLGLIRTGMYRNGDKMPLWGWIAIGIFTVLVLAAAASFLMRRAPEQDNINANPPFPIPPMNLAVPSGARASSQQRGRVSARRTAGAIAAKESTDG